MNSNENFYQQNKYPPEEQLHHPSSFSPYPNNNNNQDNQDNTRRGTLPLGAGIGGSYSSTNQQQYQEEYQQQQQQYEQQQQQQQQYSVDNRIPERSEVILNNGKVKQPGAFKQLISSLNTRNQLLYLFTLAVQGIVALTMIGLIYGTISDAVGTESVSDTLLGDPKLETVATYLALFILAVLFELLVSLDALSQKNILQIGLLLVFQVALLAYSAVLPHQLFDAIVDSNADTLRTQDYVRAYSLVIPIIIGIITFVMSVLTWLLYSEFGWAVFKRIGADLKLKKMYQLYQIYVCLLKFSGFFFVGFEIQFLVLVSGVPTVEFVLTIAALPIILVCLLFAAFVVRMESRKGVYAFFVLQFLGLAYFFYKLVRIFDSSSGDRYKTAQASLTIFSVASIVLLLLTFIVTGLCFANFGQGLKQNIPPYLYSKRSRVVGTSNGRQDGNGEKLNGDRQSVRMSLE